MEAATSARQESRRWRRIWPIVIAVLALGVLAGAGKVFDVGARVEPFLRWVQERGVRGPAVIVVVYAAARSLLDATSGDLSADWRVQAVFWAGLAIAAVAAVFVARVARRALKAAAINDGSDQSHGQTTNG